MSDHIVEVRYDGGIVKGEVVGIFVSGDWRGVEEINTATVMSALLTRNIDAVRVRSASAPWTSPDVGFLSAYYTEVRATAITAVLYSRKETTRGT